MSDLRAAAQQALEALEKTIVLHDPMRVSAITALRAALEQEPVPNGFSVSELNHTKTAWKMGYDAAKQEQQEQEPVAWNSVGAASLEFETECADGTRFLNVAEMPSHAVRWRVVTPSRRKWRGLTEEEIEDMSLSGTDSELRRRQFARAIEAALKEKNHD